MKWETMLEREPELSGIQRACRAARQQNATWFDFWIEHEGRITVLVSRWPTSRLRQHTLQEP